MSERVWGALAQAGKAAASPEAALGDRPASLERGAMALLPSFPSLPADRGPGVQRQTYQHFRSPNAGPGGVCVGLEVFVWTQLPSGGRRRGSARLADTACGRPGGLSRTSLSHSKGALAGSPQPGASRAFC